MNDGKRQVADETEPDENPIATIHYENGTELTGKAVTLQDGTVGVRIPGEFVNLPDLTVGASVPFAEMIASGMAT